MAILLWGFSVGGIITLILLIITEADIPIGYTVETLGGPVFFFSKKRAEKFAESEYQLCKALVEVEEELNNIKKEIKTEPLGGASEGEG